MNSLDYFSDVATDYAEYRPSYPASAIDTMLEGFQQPSTLAAADIGAGTGIGSRLLAQRGIRVQAIEPNADMRSAAIPHQNIEWIAGSAEQLPLLTSSIDLVVSFQAFHWFEFGQSLREFQRILKPTGRLALLWNFWNQADSFSHRYTHILYEVAKRYNSPAVQPQSGCPNVNDTRLTDWVKRRQYGLFWQGIYLPHFKQLDRRQFMYQQTLDRAGLIGCALSQGFLPRSGAGVEDLCDRLDRLYADWKDKQGRVRLVYQTYLYTAAPVAKQAE
ncbi:class I SAM-dependent methyltransferase [Nodosilinea sp. LEGE 07088]|uniref:class I SAM-dependent methyltransferase n=1 Tax=Nodosilinea sp. LEGE 07088 TaxID=2777968 RepID=UPI001D148719|nr:class I SAM-dependent methyltransferase [Nodosilinea sp. LEGE 07088]